VNKGHALIVGFLIGWAVTKYIKGIPIVSANK